MIVRAGSGGIQYVFRVSLSLCTCGSLLNDGTTQHRIITRLTSSQGLHLSPAFTRACQLLQKHCFMQEETFGDQMRLKVVLSPPYSQWRLRLNFSVISSR